MARVGFIGVGNMGGPMARNLIKAGHSLKVYDLSDEAVENLRRFLAHDFEFITQNLPDHRAFMGHGGRPVRRLVKHHALAYDCAGLGHADQHFPAKLAANQLNLAFKHESEPLARGGFVKKVIARSITNRRAAIQNRGQVLRFDANPLCGFRDGIGIEFHKFNSGDLAKKKFCYQ